MSIEKQIVVIFAVTQGYLDVIPVERVRAYEEQLMSYLDGRGASLIKELSEKKAIDDKVKPALVELLKEFAKQFAPAVTPKA